MRILDLFQYCFTFRIRIKFELRGSCSIKPWILTDKAPGDRNINATFINAGKQQEQMGVFSDAFVKMIISQIIYGLSKITTCRTSLFNTYQAMVSVAGISVSHFKEKGDEVKIFLFVIGSQQRECGCFRNNDLL